jgi:peptidyl-prolyl cis-trans isomerase C
MKRNTQLLPLFASIGLLLSQNLFAADSDVLAIVNGKKVTAGEYNRYVEQVAGPGSRHEPDREKVLQQLIDIELINRDALKKKYDKDPEFIAAMNEIKRSQLASYAVRKAVTAAEASSAAEIKSEYDRIIGEMPKYEYNAHHVLVNSEDEAKAIITALEGGAKIDALAKEKSIDPYASEGGALEWFTADQMEPAFAEAITTLKKGEYTKAPVQTSYGWHVIQLDDTRDLQPPALEQVEDQIRASLLGQRIQRYIESLRAKAKIEIK